MEDVSVIPKPSLLLLDKNVYNVIHSVLHVTTQLGSTVTLVNLTTTCNHNYQTLNHQTLAIHSVLQAGA